jgi:hypothetical protein
MKYIFLMLFTPVLACCAMDLVPMPKKYAEEPVSINIKNISFAGDSDLPQYGIAVEELKKVLPSQDQSQPGTVIRIAVTPAAPAVPRQAQAYAIAMTPGEIAISGYDAIGALYGAMTLRQMLLQATESIPAAEIADWPDFQVRSGMAYNWTARGLSNDLEAGAKEAIDLMLHFKLNTLTNYRPSSFRTRNTVDEALVDTLGRINEYAIQRGFYPVYICNAVAVYDKENYPYPKDVSLSKWKCVLSGRSRLCCWSEDEALNHKIETESELCARANIRIAVFHCVDSGGARAPENWLNRCDRCKARWKDDERHLATIENLTRWHNAFKAKIPTVITGSPINPYHGGMLDGVPNLSPELFELNVRGFWDKVNRALPPEIGFWTWSMTPEQARNYRAFLGPERNIFVSDNFVDPSGLFSAHYRLVKSVFLPDAPRQMMWLSSGNDMRLGNLHSMVLNSEYTWSANAPGSAEFDGGTYYDPLTGHTQPKEIFTTWLPRMCRLLYGQDLGATTARILALGIMPNYLANPEMQVLQWNKSRQDPFVTAGLGENQLKASNRKAAISDSQELLHQQIDLCQEAWRIVKEEMLPKLETAEPKARKYAMMLCQNIPVWKTVAEQRYAMRAGNALLAAAKYPEAVEVLSQALQAFDANVQDLTKTLKPYRSQPAFSNKQWTMPKLPALRQELDLALTSARITLSPRRFGPLVKVGVLNGFGAQGSIDYLSQFSNVTAELITDINLQTLDKYDCVFLMGSKNPTLPVDGFHLNVGRYVREGGGGVLIEHVLCGTERFSPGKSPFPELVQCAPERVDIWDKKLNFKGQEVEQMYVDFFQLQPGQHGEVIAESQGRPVVVQGTAGHGRVIFNGSVSLLGSAAGHSWEEATLQGFNAQLAEYAIQFFTGIKPIRK